MWGIIGVTGAAGALAVMSQSDIGPFGVVTIVLAVFIDYDVLNRFPALHGNFTGLPRTAISYFIGAICSATAGYVGMYVAVRANVRTANKAREGLNPALRVAFSSGSGWPSGAWPSSSPGALTGAPPAASTAASVGASVGAAAASVRCGAGGSPGGSSFKVSSALNTFPQRPQR